MQTNKVPVTLDKPRSLRFDVNALIALGDALNVNLMTKAGWEVLIGKVETPAPHTMDDKPEPVFVPAEPSFAKVRAIVWAGLLHEDESLTLRQVGAMLDPANLAPVIAAYTKAFQAGDTTESPAGQDPNAAPPTPNAPASSASAA